MNLTDLGFTNELSEFAADNELTKFSIGRVTQEHRERYVVFDGKCEFEAEITGHLRFSAESRADFPAVGDWVAISTYDSEHAIIHKILPRRSILKRQAVDKPGEIQIISTNIDVAFIIQAINNNFNINRLERYMTICNSSNIEPVLVISKTDLSTEKDIQDALNELEKRNIRIKYFLLSNINFNGLEQLRNFIQTGKTYCVIGSSGVGKSSLINNLLKKNLLKTGSISLSTNKGRHITDHRELFVLENGGIIIDTPGMREIGVTDNPDGVISTFHDIFYLATKCRFSDCNHTNETGCAVIEAVNNGSIDNVSYNNYLKIQKEQERLQTTIADKRKKDRVFARMINKYNKSRENGL